MMFPALMQAARAITEARAAGFRIDPKAKRDINADLRKAGFDGKGRFSTTGQALAKAAEVMRKHGLEWDEVLTTYDFSGAEGMRSIALAKSTSNPFAPQTVAGTALAFSWTELRPGHFEVISYLG